MPRHRDVVGVRHVGDLAGLQQSAHLLHVGHDDIHGALFEQLAEAIAQPDRLPRSRQYFRNRLAVPWDVHLRIGRDTTIRPGHRLLCPDSPFVLGIGMMPHGLMDDFPLALRLGSRTLIRLALMVAGFGQQFPVAGPARRFDFAGL